MAEELTERQGDALVALYRYIASHNGVSPSMDDLAGKTKVKSRSTIRTHLDALEARGMIASSRHPTSGERFPRTLRITERGRKVCESIILASSSTRGKSK